MYHRKFREQSKKWDAIPSLEKKKYKYIPKLIREIEKQHILSNKHLKKGHHDHISRLTVVSRAAKQSRTSDTTVCYIHERSILIERSLKACYKKIPYEKTTRVTRTTSYH